MRVPPAVDARAGSIPGAARYRPWAAPGVAVALALVGLVLGWRGVDLPAQVYRVSLFQQHGLTLWDSQWYGGHWTLDYSVLFPPIASVVGVPLTGMACAAAAAWAFDRIVISHFGPAAWTGSMLFAAGTTVQLAIGQLPFLMGEALALVACQAASRRRWVLAVPLAVATSLASPLAGAFLVLAGLGWLIAAAPVHRVGLVALIGAVATPALVLAYLFPGQGMFPFPFGDFVFEGAAAVVMWLLVPARERALRNAVCVYVAAIGVSYLVHTPMGGNIGRLGEVIAIPVAACLLWPIRRWLLVVLAVPMALWQWTPAWGAMTSNAREPSTHAAYFAPVLDFLGAHANPIGRVEIVPTRFHWEAAYVAPTVALARGWERQLDTADNPMFYGARPLDAASYYEWLVDNGVRFVAVPDAPLDFAGLAEAGLIDKGVPGLTPEAVTDHWRIYSVTGSTGIVSGPATLHSAAGDQVQFEVTAPGTVILRLHFSPRWTLTAGSGCLRRTPDGWIAMDATGPGDAVLQMRLAARPGDACAPDPAPVTRFGVAA